MVDIVLFALSIVKGEELTRRFVVKDNNSTVMYSGDYISAMEPIIRYKLSMRSDNDTEFIILCSQAVLDTISKLNMSSYDYLIERIKTFTHNEGIPDGRIKYKAINIDEATPVTGIYETAEYIRSKKGNIGHFWVDTHGGFRDISLMLEGILSLLKVYDIMPDIVYGIRYNEGRETELIEQTEAFRIFDFVSGINEFINYGRIDIIKGYYKNTTNTALLDVLKAMETVSDGIQMCDPESYVKGLNELEKTMFSGDELIRTGELLFDIFLEYIRNDYGELLDSKKRTPLMIIRRSTAKKMYQQALTFIESLMPEFFIDNKLIYYNREKYESVVDTCKIDNKKNYMDNGHYIFDTGCINVIYYFNRELTEKIKSGNKNYAVRDTDYLICKAIEMACNPKVLRTSLQGGLPKELRLNPDTKIPLLSCIIDPDKKNLLGKILRLHKALKGTRNLVNHSNGNIRPPMEGLINAINLYIEMFAELGY